MFLWHCRGGWNPLDAGTTVARLVFWIIPVGIVLFSVFPWERALAGTVGAYVGLLISHGKYFSCVTWRDTFFMGVISCIRFALILIPLACGCHPEIALLSFYGLLGGLAYKMGRLFIGHTVPLSWYGRPMAEGETEYGELFFGALFGLTMSKAITLYTGVLF